LGVTVVACGQTGKVDDGFKASKGQIDSVSYLLGVNFGSMIVGNDFGSLNYSEMIKGIQDMENADRNLTDEEEFLKQFKISPAEMNDVLNSYLMARREYITEKAKAEGEAFLEANKNKDGIKVTASGLQYKIIAAGSDNKPSPTDAVLVNYKGTLVDGTVFDQSPEGEPVELTLDRVIPGWTEGLQLIGEGGKIELYIPSELAYGEAGAGASIAPNSALIFDVELVEVKKVSEEE